MIGIGSSIFILGYKHSSKAQPAKITINGLVSDTNQQRVESKMPPLVISPSLSKAAQSKANDMVAKNYWSHISPSGETRGNY